MKQVYDEVHGAEELQALKGCKIISISGVSENEGEGLCLDCADEAGNLVSFLILPDGSWHLHESKPIQDTRNGALTRNPCWKVMDCEKERWNCKWKR